MAIYATAADLATHLLDNEEVEPLADDAAAERLLARAERDVDRMLGPYPIGAATGLKLVPAALTAPQRAALMRATVCAAEFRLQLHESELVGGDEYAPEGLQVVRRGSRTSPRMLEELAGSGLLRFSACALPTPKPTTP